MTARLGAAVACVLLVSLAAGPVAAFTGAKTPPGMPGDVKYIKCGVCQHMAKHLLATYRDVKSKKGKTFKEEDLIDALERFTDPIQPEGNWIAKVDLVEQGDKLVLEEQDQIGECGRECKTVRMAAEKVLGEHDTDVAEKMFTGDLTRAQLMDWLCYKLTKSCTPKPPPLPASRPKGPEFKPLDESEATVQNTLASMKAQGLGGEVFSRDEAIKKYMGLADDEDLDDLDMDDVPDDMRGMYSELIQRAKESPGVDRDPVQRPPTTAAEDKVAALLANARQQVAPYVDKARELVLQHGGGLAKKLVEMADKAGSFVQGLLSSGEPQQEL